MIRQDAPQPCPICFPWAYSAYLVRLCLATPNFLQVALLPCPSSTDAVQPAYAENEGFQLLYVLPLLYKSMQETLAREPGANRCITVEPYVIVRMCMDGIY